jgi:hypothetical protein
MKTETALFLKNVSKFCHTKWPHPLNSILYCHSRETARISEVFAKLQGIRLEDTAVSRLFSAFHIKSHIGDTAVSTVTDQSLSM